MSLINDALKRAKQAQSAADKNAATPEPMRPADAHHSVGLPKYFFPILLCVFCGAFWIVVRGWDSRRQAGIYPETVKVQARSGPAPTASAPVAVETPAEPAEAAIPENRNFALDDQGGRGGAGVADPVVAATPAFRLQGIFYRPAGPSAVVNAKTVYIGDLVSGARVKAIDRQSVTLEQGGQTQILTLQ